MHFYSSCGLFVFLQLILYQSKVLLLSLYHLLGVVLFWFFFFFLFFWLRRQRAQKQGKKKGEGSYSSFSLFLSSSTRADLYYLTALVPSVGTSAWTRAQECWPSGRTLRRAATGWGSACLTGCGRMWSQASEFTSGIWKKRPSCHLPRCVWQVTAAVTDPICDSQLQHLYLGVLIWPFSRIQVEAAANFQELDFFHFVTFPLDSSGHCFQLAFDLKSATFID